MTNTKFSIEKARKEEEQNAQRAKENPDIQEKFQTELMQVNPNDYQEMKSLYESFGFTYSPDLWVLQQMYLKEQADD